MGRCDGFCRAEMSQEEYNRRIDLAVQLLEGKVRTVTAQLEEEMRQASEDWKFEEAAALRDRIADRPAAACQHSSSTKRSSARRFMVMGLPQWGQRGMSAEGTRISRCRSIMALTVSALSKVSWRQGPLHWNSP